MRIDGHNDAYNVCWRARRDHLMRLRVSDLELLELARWSVDNFTVSVCLAKGQQPVSI